ncbi:hypothetical protein DP939_28735 [Spongiactinospora rosea]|uniref:DUF1062 domain-containing protein n=1 Tax=Spongiactinospora rosea TaxID=2248750 RepID=A0A366LRW6_9ACTN|nr:DUF1062 domain-containing protein [Spongiactinospora rosea]RBQ16676.1 hypothetical protein DP939_28735 [Spongiactinospora rosea]
MSPRSHRDHFVLPWTVRRTRLPLLAMRCPDCRAEASTVGEGRFRINANGKLLDVWLLVRCAGCARTSKVTVHERVPVRSLDPARLRAFESNDQALVARTLLDPAVARRNRFVLDWRGAWRLESSVVEAAWPYRVDVGFLDPVPVRPERLIAQGLGISRGEVERRIKSDLPLKRTTSTDFSFVVMPAG